MCAMTESMTAMKAALRVLTATTQKADPDPSDIDVLRVFAPDVHLPHDELACEVIQRAMRMQVHFRRLTAG